MAAEVVSLKGNGPTPDRLVMFQERLSSIYSEYVRDHGYAPDGCVFYLGGINQGYGVQWLATGRTEGSAGALLAMAFMGIMKEAANG